ncbi:hypothetical protein LTS18_010407 [Coniosporium uncinatum]|uniref:Uncharacterized protein n=1 Tax=Coniosporium uncinatum TaxID=93489 RepID=A0ACC3D9P8_9PEZI|nr:hypothetical protein LTS18_010407 [Coniosporium uncinatum]
MDYELKVLKHLPLDSDMFRETTQQLLINHGAQPLDSLLTILRNNGADDAHISAVRAANRVHKLTEIGRKASCNDLCESFRTLLEGARAGPAREWASKMLDRIEQELNRAESDPVVTVVLTHSAARTPTVSNEAVHASQDTVPSRRQVDLLALERLIAEEGAGKQHRQVTEPGQGRRGDSYRLVSSSSAMEHPPSDRLSKSYTEEQAANVPESFRDLTCWFWFCRGYCSRPDADCDFAHSLKDYLAEYYNGFAHPLRIRYRPTFSETRQKTLEPGHRRSKGMPPEFCPGMAVTPRYTDDLRH